MKLIKVIFIAAIFGFASAQIASIGDVEIEYDEFTGDRTCIQSIIANGEMSYGVSRYGENSDGGVVFFFLEVTQLSQSPFGFGSPMNGEVILVKIGEEISEWNYFDVFVEPVTAFSTLIAIAIPLERESLFYLLRTDEEVRIRFDGDERNYDFTYPRDVRSAFSRQFLIECFSERGQQG